MESQALEQQEMCPPPPDRGGCGPQRDVEVKCCRARAGGEACEGVGGGWRGTEGAAACVNVPPLIVLWLYSPGLDGTDLEILIREQSPRLPSVTQLELLRGAFVP